LQEANGAVHLIRGTQIVSRTSNDEPFRPLTADEMADQLLAELPPGFGIYQTPHYVVAHRTSRDFAKWTASMLERLHRAFVAYWKRQGFDLQEPEFPLPVIVYGDSRSYAKAAAEELGGGVSGVVGYYNLETNRVKMFDLTGSQRLQGAGRRRSSLKEINRILTVPAAVPLVSTVVHEATHQIAFNCGLQARFADLPLWLVEGMAVYFEAPDLSSGRGWRGIGKVNYPRLQVFQRNLSKWNEGSLAALVATDKRLRDPRSAGAAYADAWALNYFLIKQRPKQYNAYLQAMAAKPALRQDTPDERLEEFREHFGDLGELQRDFLTKMSRLK
ncbi:MAG: DUF1570 domain-containing protein, partial [Planctomycetota bacterium]